MRKFKKKGAILFAAVLTSAFLFTMQSFAGNENIAFRFFVSAFQTNGKQSSQYGRLRSTNDPNNSWKVDFNGSGEGTGTVTTFWLEKSAGPTNVSPARYVKQGSQVAYTEAYRIASDVYVLVTGENNNYNLSSYWVSGYWDEETGVKPNF